MSYSGKSAAVLNWLQGALSSVGGSQEIDIGIPPSYDAQVTVSVSMMGRIPADQRTGYHETTIDYYVELAYDVGGATQAGSTAEIEVANWLDAIEDLWLDDRTATNGTMAGLVRTWSIDFSMISDPRYRLTAGAELRLVPVMVRTVIPRP